MIDPISNLRNFDPFMRFLETHDYIYVLTDVSINKLSNQVLRKPSPSDPLHVRKITPKMLKVNQKLAEEVCSLALAGLLGFSSKSGSLQFRQDFADKIGATCRLNVINQENPEQVEVIEARVTGLDQEAYLSLTGLSEETKTEEKEKRSRKSLSQQNTGLPAILKSNQDMSKQEKVLIRGLFDRVIQQLRQNEKARKANAKERREAEARIEQDEIKHDILKHEIKNREIKKTEIEHTEQIARRNDGKK